MSKYYDRAVELRQATDRHYNCAQGVFIPFAEDCGWDTEQAYKCTANFGSGLKMGATCGAVVGGLMALALYGKDDPKTVKIYYDMIRDNHQGLLDCKDLLRVNREKGMPQKQHCDGMVYECLAVVEKLIG